MWCSAVTRQRQCGSSQGSPTSSRSACPTPGYLSPREIETGEIADLPSRRDSSGSPLIREGDRGSATGPHNRSTHGTVAVVAPAPTDLAIGAFSQHPPWDVDVDAMPWRRGVDRLRRATAASVPNLVRRRRLPPGVRVVRTGVALGTAVAGWYAVDRRRGDASGSRAGLSRRLRRAFEQLGPTYIKLGQIISSGEGIFPDELVAEFRHLRDRVPAEPFATVRRIIEDDLGRPLEAVFSHIEETPRAAASIAQVHDATLRTGEQVVVKVQRPTVARLVGKDLAAMSWIAPALVGRIPVAALANPP